MRRNHANVYYDSEDEMVSEEINYDLIGHDNDTLIDKLVTIADQLGSRALVFTLLRNTPNFTFDQIFEAVGPSLENTVVFCSDAGMNCTNITKFKAGHFSKCFDYATSQNNTRNTVSDEGISNAITLSLMSGLQLSSVAFQQFSNSINEHPLFENTFEPLSADGFRLMLSSPGVLPDIGQQGVDISTGQSTLIAITGKEVIRLPEPYSSCVDKDYELEMLRENVKGSLKQTPLRDRQSTYAQQDCRSACLQRIIWAKCHCLDLQSRLPFGDVGDSLLCGALGSDEMKMLMNPRDDQIDCFTNLTELSSAKCGFLHKIIEDLSCMKSVKYDFIDKKQLPEFKCSCPPPCYSYEYEMSISSSRWPAAGPEMHAAYRKLVLEARLKDFEEFPEDYPK